MLVVKYELGDIQHTFNDNEVEHKLFWKFAFHYNIRYDSSYSPMFHSISRRLNARLENINPEAEGLNELIKEFSSFYMTSIEFICNIAMRYFTKWRIIIFWKKLMKYRNLRCLIQEILR